MSDAFFDLWDVDTGNSLGTYETEAEAFAVVRALLDAHGPDYARDLDLGFQDGDGRWRRVAMGNALAELVGAHAPAIVGRTRAATGRGK